MVKSLKKNKIVLDFDSTFVKAEALDELAKFALMNNPKKKELVEEIKNITSLGMSGKISFPEALSRRLKIFSADRGHIQGVVDLLKGKITDSFLRNKEFIVANSDKFYVVSGGFREMIIPVVADFGITEDRVFANEFIFSKEGGIIGANEKRPLSKEKGKVRQLKELNLGSNLVAIGDGWTDYQLKEESLVEDFVAFFENVYREEVAQVADVVVNDFDEVIKFLK